MSWERLKTDYVDAVFEGFRKYKEINNPDGTKSFADVTAYIAKEGSFIGAKDINAMNMAMNYIMEALNNGTDLYDVFTEFFERRKELFKDAAEKYNIDFSQYIDELKKNMEAQWDLLEKDYTDEVERFEDIQEAVFNAWVESIKNTLASVENGELLLKLEKMIEDMHRIATDTDIEAIINGKYVDDDNESSIFETASDDDIDEIINGTYVCVDDET